MFFYLFSHVFWLEHLIHLYLQLLIGVYSFPFFSPLHLCSSLSLFLHLLKAVPLVTLAMLVWWWCTLLAYYFVFWSRKFNSLSILNESLLDRVVCFAGSHFSLLGIFCTSPFWLAVFLVRNQLVALSECPCMLLAVSPLPPLESLFVFKFCHSNCDVSWSGPLGVDFDWDSLWFLYLCVFSSLIYGSF